MEEGQARLIFFSSPLSTAEWGPSPARTEDSPSPSQAIMERRDWKLERGSPCRATEGLQRPKPIICPMAHLLRKGSKEEGERGGAKPGADGHEVAQQPCPTGVILLLRRLPAVTGDPAEEPPLNLPRTTARRAGRLYKWSPGDACQNLQDETNLFLVLPANPSSLSLSLSKFLSLRYWVLFGWGLLIGFTSPVWSCRRRCGRSELSCELTAIRSFTRLCILSGESGRRQAETPQLHPLRPPEERLEMAFFLD